MDFELGDLVRYSKEQILLNTKQVGKVIGWRRTSSGRKHQYKVYWSDGTTDWYSPIWLEKIEKTLDKKQ